jgi:hypothetical protein
MQRRLHGGLLDVRSFDRGQEAALCPLRRPDPKTCQEKVT